MAKKYSLLSNTWSNSDSAGFGPQFWSPRGKNKKRSHTIMPVVRVDCLCECDVCSKRFGVELDVAEDLNQFDSYEEMVKETVRQGFATCYTWGVRGKQTVDRFPLAYHVTIQAELLLCDECSKKCDDYPEEGDLTREQVFDAIRGAVDCYYSSEEEDFDEY